MKGYTHHLAGNEDYKNVKRRLNVLIGFAVVNTIVMACLAVMMVHNIGGLI